MNKHKGTNYTSHNHMGKKYTRHIHAVTINEDAITMVKIKLSSTCTGNVNTWHHRIDTKTQDADINRIKTTGKPFCVKPSAGACLYRCQVYLRGFFEKSACEHIGYVRMLSWFVSITNGTCTLVDELLHCVAESIWREREQIESCVLHMRSALRYTHVSSMFPAYPFKWKFCEVVWCENFHKFTDAQVACFVRCLLGPAAICIIGGVLAFLCLVTAVGRISNNSFIAWCIKALLVMIVAVIWIGYKPKLFTLFSVVNILKFVIDCDCCEV
ncbi:hypothetical protein MAR_004260 [Mya arenaria]|uniref:Uncharacterized protein n=1 Tax=Mya arenaria TaxID=6604 RepID=A0ABY7EXT6_MYAAR|nr:hypothetical protein MAR_004260 [Mya arenaria]